MLHEPCSLAALQLCSFAALLCVPDVFPRTETKEPKDVKEKCLGQDLPRKLLDLHQEHSKTIQHISKEG